jgi:hypothetical protein
MATAKVPPSDPASFLPPAQPWTGASESLIAGRDDPWVTPAEASGFTSTPSYDQTVAWLTALAASCPYVRLESFGTTGQQRTLVDVVVSRDGNGGLDPSKPTILLQSGIHSGEIDGKDAGLMLLRDICFRDKVSLIDRVNIVFLPVLNADGHERSSPYSRPNQRGPLRQGWRNTAQNLNLNRDYMKADSPEMVGLLGLFRRYDPTLYIDLHVTDGMDYAYDVTYGFHGWNGRYADSPNIGKWLDTTYRPAADAALSRNGHIPGPLIFERDNADLSKGLDLYKFPPRFSNAYGDVRRTPSVLVENHSLKPYRQRVLGTYILLETSIKLLATDGGKLKAAIAADRALRPTTMDVNWKTTAQPLSHMDFKTIDGQKVKSEASGSEVMRWNGKAGATVNVPVYGSEPGLRLSVPKAYWVPSTKPDVIARLQAHGIVMDVLKASREVDVDMIRFTGFKVASPSEGRYPTVATGLRHEKRKETFPAGSVRISTDQPLGLLAAMLLEPEAEDSFFSWGFFPEILQRVEYMEPYVIAPMADDMLDNDPGLKAEFDAKLKVDPTFASSPLRRLQFFYEHSPFYDQRYLLYPVGREIGP